MIAFAFASTVLQRVVSFQRRASRFRELNIDNISSDIIIDAHDKTNHFYNLLLYHHIIQGGLGLTWVDQMRIYQLKKAQLGY